MSDRVWAAESKKWLDWLAAKGKAEAAGGDGLRLRGPFDGIVVSELVVSSTCGGRFLCTFRVPAHVTDTEGIWDAGAITTMIDTLGQAVATASAGCVHVSVDLAVSFFAPARIDEEVEIDARTVGCNGEKLSMVETTVRKKGRGRELVAIGRLWMAAIPSLNHTSKL